MVEWHRKPRRRRVAMAIGAVVVIGAAVAALVLVRGARTSVAQPPAPQLATATVQRTDLVQRQRFDGTLGYDGSYQVPGTAAPGAVLTALPAEGQVIHRGQSLYSVNTRPVPLLIGRTPLWRRLADGADDGPDVTEVEQNLHAMGYADGLDVDGHFTAATAEALARWQRALGVPDTGALEPQDAVVQPGDVRVTAVRGTLGAPPSGSVLTLSGTGRIVTAAVPVAQQNLVRTGAAVQVGLPTGRSTAGRISSIGTVAAAANGPGGDQQSGDDGVTDATISIRITLSHPGDAGSLDGAPVTVDVVSDKHTGVLAAPVNALLANPDGSYAVDVVEGPDRARTTRRVPVRLGFFAGGLVEVSGAGLAEGTKVQVPSPS